MYTHETHAKRCAEAANSRQTLITYVQVKTYKTTACGRLAGAWTTSDGVDFWYIDLLGPVFGRFSSKPAQVRQCSGIDGACICACEPDFVASYRAEPATHEALATSGKPHIEVVTCK